MKSIILALGLVNNPAPQVIPSCNAVIAEMMQEHERAGDLFLSSEPNVLGVAFFWGNEKTAKVMATVFVALPPNVEFISQTFKRQGSCITDKNTLAEYFTAEYSAN